MTSSASLLHTAKTIGHAIAQSARTAAMMMVRGWKETLLCAAADIAFFVLFGFVDSAFMLRIQAALLDVGSLLGNAGIDSITSSEGGLLSLVVKSGGGPGLIRIVLLIGLLGLCTFALFSLAHGFIWSRVFAMRGRKDGPGHPSDWTVILKRFALVNILWVGLVYLQRLVYFLASFFAALRTHDASGMDSNPILIGMLLAIAYFAVISYSFLGTHRPLAAIKESFRLGVLRTHLMIPPFLSMAALFILLNYALALAGTAHPAAVIAAGTLLVIPALTWCRLFSAEYAVHALSLEKKPEKR